MTVTSLSVSLQHKTRVATDCVRQIALNHNHIKRDLLVYLHINPLKPKLNPICYLPALLGAHHFLHVSRIRVKLLTFRLLMS